MEAIIDPISPYTPKHPELTADDVKKFNEEPERYDFQPKKLDLSPEFHQELVRKNSEPIKSDYNLRSKSKSNLTTFNEKVKIIDPLYSYPTKQLQDVTEEVTQYDIEMAPAPQHIVATQDLTDSSPEELLDSVLEVTPEIINESDSELDDDFEIDDTSDDEGERMSDSEPRIDFEPIESTTTNHLTSRLDDPAFIEYLDKLGVNKVLRSRIREKIESSIPNTMQFRKKLEKRINQKVQRRKVLRVRAFLNDCVIKPVISHAVEELIEEEHERRKKSLPFSECESIPRRGD